VEQLQQVLLLHPLLHQLHQVLRWAAAVDVGGEVAGGERCHGGHDALVAGVEPIWRDFADEFSVGVDNGDGALVYEGQGQEVQSRGCRVVVAHCKEVLRVDDA